MITNENRIILERIANDYELKYTTVVKYFEILNQYPFIADGDQEKMFECLEEIVSDRATAKEHKGNYRTINETITEYLYRYYDEEAFTYLNKEFLDNRGINSDPEYDGYDDDLRPEEKIEKGYSRRLKN